MVFYITKLESLLFYATALYDWNIHSKFKIHFSQKRVSQMQLFYNISILILSWYNDHMEWWWTNPGYSICQQKTTSLFNENQWKRHFVYEIFPKKYAKYLNIFIKYCLNSITGGQNLLHKMTVASDIGSLLCGMSISMGMSKKHN